MKITALAKILAIAIMGITGVGADNGFMQCNRDAYYIDKAARIFIPCTNTRGNLQWSVIRLFSCVKPKAGHLVHLPNQPGGTFNWACTNCKKLDGDSVHGIVPASCDCPGDNGEIVTSSINLNAIMTNKDGIMCCNGGSCGIPVAGKPIPSRLRHHGRSILAHPSHPLAFADDNDNDIIINHTTGTFSDDEPEKDTQGKDGTGKDGTGKDGTGKDSSTSTSSKGDGAAVHNY